jgi:hypothetical protein
MLNNPEPIVPRSNRVATLMSYVLIMSLKKVEPAKPSQHIINVQIIYQISLPVLLSANLALMQDTRLTDDVSRYEGVSQLYVGKQGCESLSESPYPHNI